MNRQPSLQNNLVIVRPMTTDDYDAIYDVAKDPLIWAGHPSGIDRWQPEAFRKFFDAGMASGGMLVVIDRASEQIIGSSRYDGLVPDVSIEIGWTFLSRDYWGGTYNASFKKLMIDHAHQYVKYIVYQIHRDNLRSQRATEKLGAVRTSPDAMPISLRAKSERHYSYVMERKNKSSTE